MFRGVCFLFLQRRSGVLLRPFHIFKSDISVLPHGHTGEVFVVCFDHHGLVQRYKGAFFVEVGGKL